MSATPRKRRVTKREPLELDGVARACYLMVEHMNDHDRGGVDKILDGLGCPVCSKRLIDALAFAATLTLQACMGNEDATRLILQRELDRAIRRTIDGPTQ
jgi:hypothetical protein